MMREDTPGNHPLEGLEELARLQQENAVLVQQLRNEVLERKKTEEALLRAKKLESVGILAGGIAHDFNNLLTVITGNISLAKRFLSPVDKAFGLLDKAEDVSMRASDLTEQLVTLSRGAESVRKPAVLNDLIKKASLFPLSGSTVRCEINIAADLLPVECDEGRIRQVIHNMVLNARDAMPKGGLVTVTASNVVVTAGQELPLADGHYITIAIADQGVGIPEEALPRIFKPDFTTKVTWNRKGLGLGLSICSAIIQGHSGHIAVTSKAAEGTTVTIYLPVAEIDDLPKKRTAGTPITGKGKVLIMDDEEAVRTIAVEMLSHIGCEVESARDGAEAIAQFIEARKSGRPFDIVILDLTVADGMGGKDTIKKLIEIDPSVRAIVSSGYTTDQTMSDFSKYGFKGVMPKPFNIEDLSKSIFNLKDNTA